MDENENKMNFGEQPDGYTVTPEGGYYQNSFNAENPIPAESEPEKPLVSEKASEADERTVYSPEPVVYTPPVLPQLSPTRHNVHWPTVIIAAVLSISIGIASCIASLLFARKNTQVITPSADSNTAPQNVTISVDETVNSSIEAVAKKVTPSVVGIRTTASVQNFFGGNSESTGEGSGIIYTADGYIITNYHVIESATESNNSTIEVFLASDTSTGIPATVVGYNISCDLAVVKIDRSGLTPVTVSDVSGLTVGQYVIAIGAPGGLEFMGSVTNGIISGLNRTASGTGENNGLSLIQTNAAINPGNSGGALVNLNGELIGVNSSKIVSESYEGMGFAIPADTVVEAVTKIIAKENNPDPYIGVTLSETWSGSRLQQYGYPVGAVVKSVTDGAPAAEAGIRGGDIITEFDGKAVESYTSLNEMVSDSKIGSTVSVKIYRSGRYYSTAVVIGSNNAQ